MTVANFNVHDLRDVREIVTFYQVCLVCLVLLVWMVEVYHSIVFFSPASKLVLAWKLNSVLAFVVSSILLGWPSGLVVSHIMRPLKPVSFTIRSTRSFMDISKQAPKRGSFIDLPLTANESSKIEAQD